MADISPSGASERRLFVTGCGYLGRAVVERALADGWEVTALTRNAEKAQTLESRYGIRVLVADLASDEWHGLIDAEGASVINCVSSGGGGVEGYRRSYFEGTQSLLRWAAKGNLRTFLYTGSTSVYPDADGAWVDEACEAAPSTSLNEVLIETEGLLEEAVATGLFTSAGVMRLAGIYGPGRHHLLDTLREGVREIPGSGDYYLNLIHRDDAATALCLGLAAAVPGYSVWNLSDGSPATKEAIIEWSARRLGLPLPVFRPDLITPRMKRRQLFNGRPPNRRIDSRRVREELGWTPLYPDFRTGYEALV